MSQLGDEFSDPVLLYFGRPDGASMEPRATDARIAEKNDGAKGKGNDIPRYYKGLLFARYDEQCLFLTWYDVHLRYSKIQGLIITSSFQAPLARTETYSYEYADVVSGQESRGGGGCAMCLSLNIGALPKSQGGTSVKV